MTLSLISDYTPSGGPIASAAFPGSIGNGWCDYFGSNWSVDSTNHLAQVPSITTPWSTAALLRLDANEGSLNSKIVIRWNVNATSTNSLYAMLKVSHPGSTVNCYVVGVTDNGAALQCFPVINGTLGSIITAASSTGSYVPVPGTSYDFTVTCTQTNSTTTQLVATVATTSGTTLITTTWNDTNATLQNVFSTVGLFFIGNTGTADTISRIQTYNDNVAFNLVSDYTPTIGATSAAQNPGSIGGGLTDVGGSQWSIDSSNILHQVTNALTPWNNSTLARLTTVEKSINQKITLRWNINSAGYALYAVLRYQNPGASPTNYVIGATDQTGIQLQCYPVVNGTLGSLVSVQSSGGSFVPSPGQSYDFTVTCAQVGSSTVIAATLYNTSGAAVATSQWVDSNSSLQNVSSSVGVFLFGNVGTPDTVSRIRSYNDTTAVSATSYSIGISNTIIHGTKTYGQISLVGGTALTSNLVVTVTEDLDGTFTRIPVTIPAGLNTSGTFSYTPVTVGTRTLTVSHTGGNTGMTGDGTKSITVVDAITLDMNNAAVVTSPYNWSPGSSGSGSLQSWNAGAYARFYVKGTTSANLLFDGSVTTANFAYAIDNGPLSSPIATPSNGFYSITLPDTGSHVVYVTIYNILQSVTTNPDRWFRTNYLGIKGIQLIGGLADTANVVRGNKYLIIYGDSITEGILANNGTDGNPYDYSYLLGQSLINRGFEYGIVGCGGQGYTVQGSGQVPPLYTIGNDTSSSWNKLDNANSRLSNGLLSPVPQIVVENMGTNDGLQGHTGNALTPTLSAQILGFYRALRSAAPTSLLLKVVPYGGYARSDINSAITTFGDSSTKVIDLLFDTRMSSGAYTQSDAQHIHPGQWGHANIASQLSERVIDAYDQQTGGGGSGTKYPVGIPIANIVNGSTVTSVPWAIPATGIPGSTGSVQTGSTTFTSSSATNAATELCDLLDRMVSDGRAVIS